MQDVRHITGETEDQLWQQLEADLAQNSEDLEYEAVLEHGGHTFRLDIDVDLGGGFESGYETTSFSAAIDNPDGFQFGLHHHHFLDSLGKFLGMQDIETGDAEFDAAVVVKSSDETKVRALLSDATLRSALKGLGDFTLELSTPSLVDSDHEHSKLLLTVEEAVTEPMRLRQLFDVFLRALKALD
jgi:hypothetical protein